MNITEKQMQAYGLGYFYGRAEGYNGNPFEAGKLRQFFNDGFNAGLSAREYFQKYEESKNAQ